MNGRDSPAKNPTSGQTDVPGGTFAASSAISYARKGALDSRLADTLGVGVNQSGGERGLPKSQVAA